MNFNHFDLNLLVVLDALLTEQSVTRAAARLHMTQPATSAALARLRRQLEDDILVRDGRGLRPTPYAASLTVPVREALAELESVLSAKPHFDPARDGRTFRVVVSDYAALMLLSPLVAQLQEEAPLVRLAVSPISSHAPQQLLRDEIDIVIAPIEIREYPEPIRSEVLFQDDFVCAVWRGNPLVKDELSLETFSRMPHLGYFQLGVVNYAEQQLAEAGVTREIELMTQTFALAPFLLWGTRLVAIVQKRLAERLSASAEIRVFPSPVPLKPITEAMFWHPRHDDDPGLQWLCERLRELGGHLREAA